MIRPRLLPPCCVLLIALTSAARAEDWIGFRGPDSAGVAEATGLPTTWSETENVVWKCDLPGPGTSSPTIIGNSIYLTCYAGCAE